MNHSLLLKKSARFMNLAAKLEPSLKPIEMDILQARIDISLRQHIASSIYQSINTTLMFVIVIVAVGYIIDSVFIMFFSIM